MDGSRVAKKRKTPRDGDPRSVRMSEAEEKSAKAEGKINIDNRFTAWQARAHDHTLWEHQKHHSKGVQQSAQRLDRQERQRPGLGLT